MNLYCTDQSKGPNIQLIYKPRGGGYGFKLFTLELKIINAVQQTIFFSKFIILSYTKMYESKYHFFLHLLHQHICLVFVKKHSPLSSNWMVSL